MSNAAPMAALFVVLAIAASVMITVGLVICFRMITKDFDD